MEKKINELMIMDTREIFEGNGNNTVSEKQSDADHYCGLCRVNVHQNYIEKHKYSKVHRSKLKDNGILLDLPLEQGYCSACNTVFSDKDFYEAHKGSKKHKRNAKTHQDQSSDTSAATAIISGGAFSPRAMRISLPTFNDQVEEASFIRKKYKTRPNRVDSAYYYNYINTLTAFLSLRLALDTNVKDFCISVNDKRWHSFGDIVIDVTTNKKNTVYAIKCKQVSDSGKQIDSLRQAKILMDKEYESLTSLKNIQEFAIAKFLIFTNNTTSSKFSSTDCENTVEISEKTLNLWKTETGIVPEGDTLLVKPASRRSDFIDVTSDPDNVFSIYPKLENESYELPYVFFYTSQKVNRPMVNELLRKKFENFDVSIHQQYLKYIEKWAKGGLGGHYYLNKRDVILKVGEILLSPYAMLPKKINSRNDNFDIWNQVISRVDLTIVRKENHITSKMCQPINQIIERMLVKIDGVSRSVEITDKIVNAITDPGIRAYLFEEYDTSDRNRDTTDRTSEIPINKIYNIFWKSDKVPLLLVSEKKNEHEFILEVIYFMKQYGVNRKFLLKSSKPLSDRRLRIFTCLDDVKDLVDLEKVGFTLPEGYLSLKTISSSDPFFLKWITPNSFFEMALGKYMIKKFNKNNNEQLNDLKMILDEETRRKLLVNLYGENGSLKEIENEGRLKGIDPVWF